ncbi:MAG TPA: autotransporter-associated beta strand repeat-containing protein [Candidatus Sulfotelmatobacter sp.]|nr:autotransporter-associated beta strand repeat-containing protein [Candidatus Sulfotelmatobacter sp.]
MKTIREICLVASVLTVSMVPFISDAQYYLTANDALGSSSFNSAGNWNSGAAPAAGNTYSTEHWLLRSPTSAGSYTFGGDSLTVGGTDGTSGAQPFSTTTGNNDSLIFKASGVTLTVNNLILDGAQIRDGNANGNYTHLAGNITVTTNGGAFLAQDTNYIDSSISGPGPIYIGDNGNGSAQRIIVFTSGSSTYSGSVLLTPQSGSGATRCQVAYAAGSIMNFTIGTNGENNSISGNGTLVLNGAWNINLSGADNTQGDVWPLVGATNTTYGSTFTINGFTQNPANTNLWYEDANGVLYEYNEEIGELTVGGANIVINQQPVNESVAPGNQANLSVSASGPGTLDYQWYLLTTTTTNSILGATNASYGPPPTSVLGVTNYFVVITNGISLPVTSSVASVTVRMPRNLEWAGTGSSWDTLSLNWTANGNVSQTAYTDADNVTFDALGAGQPTVSLAQALYPTVVAINGSTPYTLSGPGSIDGPASLTINDSSTVLLDTTNNTYAGGTFISSGTLQVGDGTITSSLGSGPVTNNSTLILEPGAVSLNLPGSISGTGTLTDSGSSSGNVYLTASNSYSGQTTITAGTLHPENANALGASTAPVVNTSGGNLYVDLNVNILNPLTLGGNNVSLEKGGAGVSTLGGTIGLVSSTTLSIDGGATLNLTNTSGLNSSNVPVSLTFTGSGAGNITGPLSLNSGSLTVNGGTWTVAPSNSYTGLTTINGGGLFISGPLSLGPVPASFTAADVTLDGGTLGTSTNVVLDDGNIGITVGTTVNTSRITVNGTNSIFVISNNISGAGDAVLTKTGSGTLVLAGPNTYAGALNIDSTSTTASDGETVIANNAAIADMPAFLGSPFIYINNNNGGSSTLALNGSSGSITVAPDISLAGRNVPVQSIENIAGSNTISGNFTLVVGGADYIFQADSGILNLTAPLPLTTPSASGRTFTFQGPGTVLVSGAIQDGSLDPTSTSNVWDSVVQAGPGLLVLPAANTYSGSTTVSNGVLSLSGSLNSSGLGVTVAGGLLVGNGSITGPVTVQSAGTIEAGTTNSIGTLTLGNSLTLSGNTIVKISKTADAADLFSGQTSLNYGGTLTVTNLGGTLAVGDHFTLFSPGASSSNFGSIAGLPGPGLAYSFANGVLSVVTGPPTTPTNITSHVSGNVLTLSWPANYQGWTLQAQTNSASIGLSTNWFDVPGSAFVTSTNMTINPSNPTVFYRLRYPN